MTPDRQSEIWHPQLSILTPAIPERLKQVATLCSELARQIGGRARPIEHLVLIDNKCRTIGEKRDALLRTARGKYVAFVDDDDSVSLDYVSKILDAAKSDPDVITFRQIATVNGYAREVEFKLGNPNDSWVPEVPEGAAMLRRNAWHVCAWRREIAIQSRFPAVNYGEDWAWAAVLCALKHLTEFHIPSVLHFYIHSSQTTAAPAPA